MECLVHFTDNKSVKITDVKKKMYSMRTQVAVLIQEDNNIVIIPDRFLAKPIEMAEKVEVSSAQETPEALFDRLDEKLNIFLKKIGKGGDVFGLAVGTKSNFDNHVAGARDSFLERGAD